MPHEDVLARTELFADADPAVIKSISSQAAEVALVHGDVLFNEGDSPDALYVVLRGRIAVSNRSADGRESVLALMEPGDLFGEMGMLDDRPRSAALGALESSTLLRVPYEPVVLLLRGRSHPAVGGRAPPRRAAAQHGRSAGGLGVPRRHRAHRETVAGAERRRGRVHPPGDRRGARRHGRRVTRAVNKALSSFIRLGWIEQSDRRYRIVQRDRLALRAS